MFDMIAPHSYSQVVLANLPHWTDAATQRIQDATYGIATLWQKYVYSPLNITFDTALTFSALLLQTGRFRVS